MAEHLPSLRDSGEPVIGHLGLKSEAFACRCSATISQYPLGLADGTFHLQFDQPIHFNCVFHWQFFDERFDEAGHDH